MLLTLSPLFVCRIVLNKADMVDHQQLMRVYGALMWSLGKVLGTPEVARVYIGSFWDQPLRYDMNRKLFEAEEQDLFADLQSLPRDLIVTAQNLYFFCHQIPDLKVLQWWFDTLSSTQLIYFVPLSAQFCLGR